MEFFSYATETNINNKTKAPVKITSEMLDFN